MAAAPRPGIAAGAKQPNIVLIVVEDLSSRIGAFGDPVAATPNLDRLARDGIRFDNAFATAGVCAPSRAALITGMYQQAIGAQHMRTSSFGRTRGGRLGTFSTPGPPYETVPPAAVKAFPELLREAGYVTINNAKTDYQFGTPFTIWDVSSRTASIRDRAPGRPFFLMLSNGTTHESGLFQPGIATTLEKPPRTAAANARRWAALGRRTDPAAVAVPPFLPDTAAVRTELAAHYDNIAVMDRWLGERLAELEAAGLLDDTVVIWTSDHGDGLPRAKRTLYDSGLKVPLIVRLPHAARAGQRVSELVSLIDVAPTLLRLAGAAVPAQLHGRDMLARGTTPRRYVHAARDRIDELPDMSRAVRDARFKYIRNHMPDRALLGPVYFRENLASMQALRELQRSGELPPRFAGYFRTPRPAEELYDLRADPFEMVNLAADPASAATLERLRSEHDRWLSDVGDMSAMPEHEMVTTRMWPGGRQPVTAGPQVSVECRGDTGSVSLTSPTRGASLGYRLAADPPERWRLYVAPIELPGGASIEARAIRYGYAESGSVSSGPVCQPETS